MRTEPESRSGSGRIMSSHSMRYVYMRVAARCVYMVLCGCVHAPATSHGGMCPRSAVQGKARTCELADLSGVYWSGVRGLCGILLPHLEVKCCRLRSMSVSILASPPSPAA